MKKFKNICRKSQSELKVYLEKVLLNSYAEVIARDGYLYAKGNIPVLVTAHMDTVHKETCKDIKAINTEEGKALWSPQGIGGDDRCGVWMIVKLISQTKLRPYILFCEDEEIGGVGSEKFVKSEYIDDLKEMKYLVELDRAHGNDAVYYRCGNSDFKEYIEKVTGLEEDYGSFSDISNLSPACDVASVNISCGYYNAHTLKEYVVIKELKENYKKLLLLLNDLDNAEHYDYQRKTNVYDFGSYCISSGWFDDFDELTNAYESYKAEYGLWFIYMKDNEEKYDEYYGYTISHCLSQFFEDNEDLSIADIIDFGEF